MYTVHDSEKRCCEMNIFHQSVSPRRLRPRRLKNHTPPTPRHAAVCTFFTHKNSKNGINYHNFSTVHVRTHKQK